MADLRMRRRDVLIKPKNPQPWMMRYLLLRRVSENPNRRYADRTFHGVESGCFAGRPVDPANVASTEAMVYTDDNGIYWIADPFATENQLDGWRTVEPCKVCGMVELDRIVAERLAWQHRGACYRTYHAGFFATEDGDGTGGEKKRLRAEALAMCLGSVVRKQCPMRGVCAEWGLRLHSVQPFIGILGGLDEKDRRRMLSAARSA